MQEYITIIGGGLAGSEAAYQIAKRGIKVKLYEMKPTKFSPAHNNESLAEIVCSNSLKSNLHTNACGLLKEELRMLDSLLIRIADKTAVPAGQALAVDREKFAKQVTQELQKMSNIEIIRKEVGLETSKKSTNEELEKERLIEEKQKISNKVENQEAVKIEKATSNKIEKTISNKVEEPSATNAKDKMATPIEEKTLNKRREETLTQIEQMAKEGIVIICTGPLTSNNLSREIANLTGEDKLYFYDAAAPIIEKDSIDMSVAFWGDRYEQERGKEETIENWQERMKKQKEADYLNLPMNKEEYETFCYNLIKAQTVILHDFEKREIFEGCMPIEIMAKRGKDTLRFGPLKPVGFTDKRTGKRPYAVVQLRQDNSEGNLFNMVGFQTNLKYGEQQRVFGMIPGLEKANFVKYCVMHRNTYINSTKLLDKTYQMKQNPHIYFAGQITGVEGYVESISSGLVAALNAVEQWKREQSANLAQMEQNSTQEKIIFPNNTMIGALANYIAIPNDNFQPMNANFGILPELSEKIKDKKIRYTKLADRALEELTQMSLH